MRDGDLGADALDKLEPLSPVAYGECLGPGVGAARQVRARRKALSAVTTAAKAFGDAHELDVDAHDRDDTGAAEDLVENVADGEAGGE